MKECVVVVENLPEAFNEGKLLRLFHPLGRIRVVGKGCGETSGEFHFNFFWPYFQITVEKELSIIGNEI